MNQAILLIAGAISGWLLQRITDLLLGPKIEISVAEDGFVYKDTSDEVKFLQARVKNKKRNLIFQIFLGSGTISNARTYISFKDIETKAEILKINGRWTSTKEPVDYKGGIDIGYALIASRETIPPDEQADVSIALKKIGEEESYAFNNESYLFNWKKADFKLEEKRYLVSIKVGADGRNWIKNFILLNLGKTNKNFKLLEN